MKFFVTFKDDYRFKNLFCLFELTELNYDEFSAQVYTFEKI